MDLQIFDVGHGACALLTCDDGSRLMIDCGHNADTGWKPGSHLRKLGIGSIQKLAITNYDEDHVSGIENLFENVNVERLLGNPTVASNTIRRLKTRDGMGPGIDKLRWLMDNYFTGGAGGFQPAFTGLHHEIYYNEYPTFVDENNLSVVNFLQCHGIGVLFTGDLECDGWMKLLANDARFRSALANTHLLVAPHHGRESGCCEDALELCTQLHCVIISDKDHMYDTQKTGEFYRRFANGGKFRGDTRFILSTRNDGSIGMTINQFGWTAHESKAA